MLALEHLHANALLVVLLGGALAIVSLRAGVYLLHRSLVAADRKIMSRVSSRPVPRIDLRSHDQASDAAAARQHTSAQPGELTETYQDTEQRPNTNPNSKT